MNEVEFISKHCKFKDKKTGEEISISQEEAKRLLDKIKMLESLKSDKNLLYKYKYKPI